MAFSPPEYCRLFAQKKAYQGGGRGSQAPQDPPSYAPVYSSQQASSAANSGDTDSEESEDDKKRNNYYFSFKDKDDYRATFLAHNCLKMDTLERFKASLYFNFYHHKSYYAFFCC